MNEERKEYTLTLEEFKQKMGYPENPTPEEEQQILSEYNEYVDNIQLLTE